MCECYFVVRISLNNETKRYSLLHCCRLDRYSVFVNPAYELLLCKCYIVARIFLTCNWNMCCRRDRCLPHQPLRMSCCYFSHSELKGRERNCFLSSSIVVSYLIFSSSTQLMSCCSTYVISLWGLLLVTEMSIEVSIVKFSSQSSSSLLMSCCSANTIWLWGFPCSFDEERWCSLAVLSSRAF